METRVGDVVDDYCTRCHHLTNHSVTALDGGTIASTTCRTCGYMHAYRGGREPAAKTRARPSAYDQVLASILGETPAASDAAPAKGKGKRPRR